MANRRDFLKLSALTASLFTFNKSKATEVIADSGKKTIKPIVISTWRFGIEANAEAWKILSSNGRSLDAVEAGVKIPEGDPKERSVGLGGRPDIDGRVTLDACIMDEFSNCGGVAFLERIKHPVAVARRVMDKTPHVMLVGSGAQQFAIAEGFPLEEQKLSEQAQAAYEEWLKNSQYKPPVINIENLPVRQAGKQGHGPFAPHKLSDGEWNHDTIGMVAMDTHGNMGGSCTSSGAGFKMRGRIGDSPIIGAGLFVDKLKLVLVLLLARVRM